MRYQERKSRNSITKDFGGRVQVLTKIPENTCHPGANVNFHTLTDPPQWTCAQCGRVILLEIVVNRAIITE